MWPDLVGPLALHDSLNIMEDSHGDPKQRWSVINNPWHLIAQEYCIELPATV